MKTYELTYIISPDITSEEAGAKAKELESAIQGKEGTILKQSNPVARSLSYPVGKKASGFFGVLEFQLEPEKLLEFKETLSRPSRSPCKILRHMVIIKEATEMRKERRIRTKPSPTLEIEQKTGVESFKEEKPTSVKTSDNKGKVELKDIEQKLDELLGE